MFNSLDVTNTLYFILFSTFIYAQTIQIKKFKDSGETFHPHYKRLSVFVPFVTVLEYGYIIYFGIQTEWWSGVLLLLVGYISALVINLIVERISYTLPTLMGVLGFFAIPILMYLCIVSTP
jgi:hypothetical protein